MIGECTQYNYKSSHETQLHCTCLWELNVKILTAHGCNLRAKPQAQLLLLVVTRSRDLAHECHVPYIKLRQGVTCHCPILKIPGPFDSAHQVLQVEGCAPKTLKKGRTLQLSPRKLSPRYFIS